jgi:hypothetical protein
MPKPGDPLLLLGWQRPGQALQIVATNAVAGREG